MPQMICRYIPPIHEPDYEDPKEPYAFFGLAAYFVQCFEQSVILLLLALEITAKPGLGGASYGEVLSVLDKKTLGLLIEQMCKSIDIAPKLKSEFGKLLKSRNYLMHHFFESNILKLSSETGRRAVLDELRGLAQDFQDGDKVLVSMYEPLFERLGIDQEVIKSELKKLEAASS